MTLAQRYSEPYSATGGLAAEGVINQLGRPNLEPLEVLVREAVQNCWDAKRRDARGIEVEIGRRSLAASALDWCREHLLVQPPPGLPLAPELAPGMEILHFADFGTDGLGGPTRADEPGARRDFVDFVRNIGQPPDKDLAGGSFGYGKAAFYIASRARTILIDTLCRSPDGALQRRFIGCGLGENFEEDGRPFTGRHWWGRLVNGVPEPLIDEHAAAASRALGLPQRDGEAGLGTTVVVIAPDVAPEGATEPADTMAFIAEAVMWNFWPRMIDSPGGSRTMRFRLLDEGSPVRIGDPRAHPRLRGFVDAMDLQRQEPGADEDLVLDRSIEALRPARRLGRLVVQQGPVAPVELPARAVPQGARQTSDSLHHIALMRNAELVVRYLAGPLPVTGRLGYCGVFMCAVDVDDIFRRAEPPTHDDWIYLALPKGPERTFVKVALERILGVCREAAGYDNVLMGAPQGAEIPLGEFADALASLMPGGPGTGARRPPAPAAQRTRRNAPGRKMVHPGAEGVWVDGSGGAGAIRAGGGTGPAPEAGSAGTATRRLPPPQARPRGDAQPALANDGAAVIRYPFELRTRGNRVRLGARIEVMANDGGQVEAEAPVGAPQPVVRAWIDPHGREHLSAVHEVGPDDADGAWAVEVLLAEEAMMRVDLALEVV